MRSTSIIIATLTAVLICVGRVIGQPYIAVPSDIGAIPAYARCGGGTFTTLEAFRDVMQCLAQAGYPLAAQRLAKIAKAAVSADTAIEFEQQYQAEQELDSDFAAFGADARKGKELPEYFSRFPGTCETEILSREYAAAEVPIDIDSDDVLIPSQWVTERLHDQDTLRRIGQCYASRAEWAGAVRTFKAVLHFSGDDTFAVEGQDADRAQDEWRLANALNHAGDPISARKHIRAAFSDVHDLIDLPSEKHKLSQILYDYNRLGGALADKAALRKWEASLMAGFHANAAAFAKSYMGDMHAVALQRGEPCHIEEFTSGEYHEVTWWYCGLNQGYTSAVTFVNGRLFSTYNP